MEIYTYKAFKAHRDRVFLTSFVIALVLCFAFAITYFASTSAEVRENVVRLHVLANSNSNEDQKVKLAVRDALLEKNTSLLSCKVTPQNAGEYFECSKAELEKCANEVLLENGFDYKGNPRYARRVTE